QQAAEDIVSDSFLTAIEKLGELRSNEAFGSWLYSIAYRKCLQHAQSESALARFDSDSELESSIDQSPLGDMVKLPCDRIESEETKRLLREAIESLKPDMRTAVMMYYFEQMSVAQVGEVLGISENAAKQKLFRARKKLSARLEKFFKQSGMLCAVPLGAALESAYPKGYSAAAGTAVRVGITARIAGFATAAVIAAGAPFALSSYCRQGDHRPEIDVAAKDDTILTEAEQTIGKMLGKRFEYSVDRNVETAMSDGCMQRVSEKGATEDIGIPRLFREHKQDWNISLCGEIGESSANRLKMRFDDMFDEPELYSEETPYGMDYRLYIRRQDYICGENEKYICVELGTQGDDITDKLCSVRTAGDAAAVSNSHITRRVAYLPSGKIELDISPDIALQEWDRVELTTEVYDDEQQRYPVCLMNIDGQQGKHITENGMSYTLDNSLLAKGKGWHIIIDTDKVHCTSIRLKIDLIRSSEQTGQQCCTAAAILAEIPTDREVSK
ncbi:MAG: sigma-70 family RNA polymerase sigma factor, partial [Ruminococcus sp.]|nr:sigma-70 family RNA polymerase sigma factor [Ruminococcus sp.]